MSHLLTRTCACQDCQSPASLPVDGFLNKNAIQHVAIGAYDMKVQCYFNLTGQVPLSTDQNVRRRYDIENKEEHMKEVILEKEEKEGRVDQTKKKCL